MQEKAIYHRNMDKKQTQFIIEIFETCQTKSIARQSLFIRSIDCTEPHMRNASEFLSFVYVNVLVHMRVHVTSPFFSYIVTQSLYF